ncbi:MAG: Hpt domain-containing protein [Phycisphaerae bacterium]|nr:Hpt domain-containing protein [Phycisphaerae bacterium]
MNPLSSLGPLRSTYADDPDMREIVEAFVEEMPAKVADLEAAWISQQVDDVRRLAHQLKGSGGGYGFQSVSEAAAHVERTITELGRGSSAGGIAALRQQIEHLIALCRRVSA